MELFRVDVLLKELRKDRGFTQGDLCKGICAQDSLSRIERGLRRPDWHTFERLMQRLGEDPRKYYSDIISTNDKRILDLKDRLKTLLRDRSNNGNSEAEALIAELEQDNDFTDGINKQYLLMMKAALATIKNDYRVAYKYALEGLRITRPDFDEDKISTYILFNDEVTLINQIAVAQTSLTSLEKSVEILLNLKTAIENGYIDDERNKQYMGLLYNISNKLGLLGRHDECIPICDNGVELCGKYRYYFHYPLFLYNKACSLFHMRKKEEGIKLLEKAFALFLGFGRYSELSISIKHIEKNFGITLTSISLPTY